MVKKPEPTPNNNKLSERIAAIATRAPVAGSAPNAPPTEGERTIRRPVFRNATVELASGARLAVVAKNLSETGARIEFFAHAELPDRVMFMEPTANLRRQARVVWQKDGAAGIEFVDVADGST
jgi:hypothetical protein